MTILNIETSTPVCSVAIATDGIVQMFRRSEPVGDHARQLPLFVESMLAEARDKGLKTDAVAVSEGPGSYTGLRIGVSLAKGVCYGRDLPLLSVPTLKLLCVPVLLREMVEEGALLCPMIDARRMEVYAGIYDRALREVRPVSADVVDSDTYKQWLDQQPVYFFGGGAKKCMEAIGHPNARYIDGIEPLAKWMQPLAERRLMNGQTEDVAYYVPFYLKDFVAKMPKKLL